MKKLKKISWLEIEKNENTLTTTPTVTATTANRTATKYILHLTFREGQRCRISQIKELFFNNYKDEIFGFAEGAKTHQQEPWLEKQHPDSILFKKLLTTTALNDDDNSTIKNINTEVKLETLQSAVRLLKRKVEVDTDILEEELNAIWARYDSEQLQQREKYKSVTQNEQQPQQLNQQLKEQSQQLKQQAMEIDLLCPQLQTSKSQDRLREMRKKTQNDEQPRISKDILGSYFVERKHSNYRENLDEDFWRDLCNFLNYDPRILEKNNPLVEFLSEIYKVIAERFWGGGVLLRYGR